MDAELRAAFPMTTRFTGCAWWSGVGAGEPGAFGLDAEPVAERRDRWSLEDLVVVEPGSGSAVRRLVGPWGADAFWLSLMQTVALVAAGVASGRAGRALRDRDTGGDVATVVPQAAFGSLGLLAADVAMGRLEEEVERALEHRRPLTLVLIDIHVVDDSLVRGLSSQVLGRRRHRRE